VSNTETHKQTWNIGNNKWHMLCIVTSPNNAAEITDLVLYRDRER